MLWLKARAGLRVHSGWARPPGLPRLQPSRELSGGVSGWACVVLRHKLADSGTRGAGHPSGRWIPFFPSLLSIGAWRGARRRGTRPEGLACGRRRRLEQCPASCSSEIRRSNHPSERYGGLKGLLKRTKLRRLATSRRSETVSGMRAQLLLALTLLAAAAPGGRHDESGALLGTPPSRAAAAGVAHRSALGARRGATIPDGRRLSDGALPGRRRHARRSPQGRDDARGH